MERESFEDEEIGRLLSENFVCIKVDREERPDVDKVYMTFVQVRASVFNQSAGAGFHLKALVRDAENQA